MEKEKKIKIPHLGILVTTYCNLNCRNCADLIPKRENIHYPLADIKSDLCRVLDVVEFIEEVLIIGGETLLYPELKEMLDFCAEQPKVGQLIITTNGVIKPEEKLLENLKKNNVLVRISGYPEFVVPNRKEVVSTYQNHEISVEDLENMTWMSMGEENKRGRTTKELEDIFRTCSMKTCVTMNHEGKIFFCSRQMSAYETGIYPDPEKQEYIDVRNDSDLKTSLRMFYELPYISTCDYCDGISCATTKRVGTATQILDKKYFLELLGCYEILKNEHCEGEERQQAIMSVYDIIRANTEKLYDLPECTELIEALSKAVGGKTAETYKELLEKLRRLIDTLTRDYNFAISKNVPFADVGCKKGFPNLIRVDMYGKDADILLTDADIMEAVSEKYPVDSFVYNRLYVESKLERLKKQQITCVICGLSYTQYGILEKRMPVSAVNLSVTGKDIPYTVLLAERAIELNPDIKTIIFPMTYYQGCYDMSADDIALHREVVSRVNIPILSNKRNYGGEVIGKNGYREGRTLQIYDRLLALEQARTVRDNQLKEVLKEKEYFNEMNTYPAFGGLKFDFRELDTEEKYKSAKITAEHNERVCTEEGYLEVKKYLERFLDAMKKEGREVLIFVPPMTAYLYEAYHKELKEFYYDKIVSLLYEYENVRFADLALDSAFTETDFCDFEHLNKKGAEKLTEKIGEFLL